MSVIKTSQLKLLGKQSLCFLRNIGNPYIRIACCQMGRLMLRIVGGFSV
jgi:hypothetical protein